MTDKNPVDHKSYLFRREWLFEDFVSGAMGDVSNTEWVLDIDESKNALNECTVNIIFQVPL